MHVHVRLPVMTIRRKILMGCIALTVLTAFMGAYAREAQRNLGAVTVRLYDDAFQAMSYLRSAQNQLTRIEAEAGRARAATSSSVAIDPPDSLDADLEEINANVQVAVDRALSDQRPRLRQAACRADWRRKGQHTPERLGNSDVEPDRCRVFVRHRGRDLRRRCLRVPQGR